VAAVTRNVLDGLVAEQPRFHESGTVNYMLREPELRELDTLVAEGARTLETGCGYSTVLFASKGCQHTVVTPARDEVEAVRSYCESRGIDLSGVEFAVAPSQEYLPSLDHDLDFALIDGSHTFPIPFLDWLYVAPWLTVGGRLWIDNTELWTGRVLRNFLRAEPGWRLHKTGRTFAVVVKTAPFELHNWNAQPYTRRRSRPLRRWARLKWSGVRRRLPGH
jgi:predicted O-methyltransferase YrrM